MLTMIALCVVVLIAGATGHLPPAQSPRVRYEPPAPLCEPPVFKADSARATIKPDTAERL